MIFSRPNQVKHDRFKYQPRYAKDEKKERTISFRSEGAFLARHEELVGSMRDTKYVKRVPDRKTNKVTKFILIISLMGTIYLIFTSKFIVPDEYGGELTKVLAGFFMMFIFLFLFIKKSNQSI